jgi:hypothetical protein
MEADTLIADKVFDADARVLEPLAGRNRSDDFVIAGAAGRDCPSSNAGCPPRQGARSQNVEMCGARRRRDHPHVIGELFS